MYVCVYLNTLHVIYRNNNNKKKKLSTDNTSSYRWTYNTAAAARYTPYIYARTNTYINNNIIIRIILYTFGYILIIADDDGVLKRHRALPSLCHIVSSSYC